MRAKMQQCMIAYARMLLPVPSSRESMVGVHYQKDLLLERVFEQGACIELLLNKRFRVCDQDL